MACTGDNYEVQTRKMDAWNGTLEKQPDDSWYFTSDSNALDSGSVMPEFGTDHQGNPTLKFTNRNASPAVHYHTATCDGEGYKDGSCDNGRDQDTWTATPSTSPGGGQKSRF